MNKTATCANCGKDFLIIEQEQKFLEEKGLPLPKNCPSCRQIRRLSLRGAERMLYKTQCQKCGKDIVVARDPKTVKNAIYCRADYDQYFNENDPIINEPLPEV
jgi:ssDNA-binding Zn-finger/Zn-ribbon topoisomerase 1